MSYLRTDSLFARTVLFAPGRDLRPSDFRHDEHAIDRDWSSARAEPESYRPDCPFCRGNESQTPPEVAQFPRAPEVWQARIVPNRFAAVPPDGPGGHEVVIESEKHLTHLSQLAPHQLQSVYEMVAERFAWWRTDQRCRFVTLFKNQGPQAGASLAHLHSQIVALPEAPLAVAAQTSRFLDHYRRTGHCGLLQRSDEALETGTRIVAENAAWVAFCPTVSLYPYEVWVVPREHAPYLEHLMVGSSGLSLSELMVDVAGRIERIHPAVSFNIAYRTSIRFESSAEEAALQGMICFMPRIASLAGLELGSDVHINHLSAEDAAAALRDA